MITMADIIKEGHPTLRQRASEVTMPPTEEDKSTLSNMLEYLKNSQNPEVVAIKELVDNGYTYRALRTYRVNPPDRYELIKKFEANGASPYLA